MSLLLPAPTNAPDDAPVARCESVADVAAALAGPRAPRLDLRPLAAVHVDPLRRVAWVQPGARWHELDAATQEHGLAVTGARVPATAVAAHALGSGSGWLERRMGLTADNLRAVRLLTAGGRVVLASERVNPDLFWALRGGGTFGVAVELELALRPVGPEVLGGMLVWPRDRARAVLRAYRDLMAGAPDALCGGLLLTPSAVSVLVLYAGDAERGAEHLRPLRALAPAQDGVRPTTYCAMQGLLQIDGAPRAHLRALPDAAVDALAAGGATALLQPLGGAVARVGELDTAFAHRGAAWAVQGDAGALVPWTLPAQTAERRARLAEVAERWDPYGVFHR
jgi:FAD/FMN-containing dehydrogenase